MIASPCVGSCRLDPASQLCVGCARRGGEIAAWKDATDLERGRTWAELPRRRAWLGIEVHRLPWGPPEILDFIASTFREGRGTWRVGVDGASARFRVGRGDHARVDRVGGLVTLETAAGALRLAIDDRVRVLSIPGSGSGPDRIVLANPRGSSTPPPVVAVTPVGADRGAIRPSDRSGRLYDLGLGSNSASVFLRGDASAGLAWLDRLATEGRGFSFEAADRATWGPLALVVANPLARAEVFSIGDESKGGDVRAEVDPDRLARGRDLPGGFDLPAAFVPRALFEPDR